MRSEAVLVHFYRAVVMHMDVWRQRMDATTNWAAATAAAMITFAFGSAVAPHYVLLLAMLFQAMFLLMEARRYQTFDLWRRRFRMLNRSLIVPSLHGHGLAETEESALQDLARDMGRTVPHLSLSHAAGFRIRRNYGYLFTVTGLAWGMKLEMQPSATTEFAVIVLRARVAFVPGEVVLTAVACCALFAVLLAVRAPTHDIVEWEATEHTWERWRERAPWMKRRGSREVDDVR